MPKMNTVRQILVLRGTSTILQKDPAKKFQKITKHHRVINVQLGFIETDFLTYVGMFRIMLNKISCAFTIRYKVYICQFYNCKCHTDFCCRQRPITTTTWSK